MMSETGHLNFKKRRRKFDIRPDKTNFGKAFKKLLCGCSKSTSVNEDSKNIKRFDDDDIKYDDSKASPLFQNITRQFFEQELAKCFNKTSLKVFNNPKVDNKKSLLAISSNDTLETQCLSAATFFSTSFFQVSTPLQYQTYPISVNYYNHNPANTTDRGCQYEPDDSNDKTTSTKHAVADRSTQIDTPRLPPLLIQKIIKCLDLMSSSEPLDQTLQTSPVMTCNKETNTGGNLKSTTVLFANHGNMVESSDEQASGMRFNFEAKTKKKKCLRYTSPVNEAKKHCCTSTSDTCMYTEVQAKFQEWLQFMQKTKKVTHQGVQRPEYHQANSTQTRIVPTDLERKEAISRVAEFLTCENPLLTEDIQKSFNKLAAYREGRRKVDLQNQKYPSFIVTEKCKLCEGKRKKIPKIIIEKKKKKTKEDVDPLSEKFIASLSDNGLQKVDEDIAEITSEIKQYLKAMVDDISDINLHGDQKYDCLESGSSKDDSLNSLLTTDLELQPFDEEFFTMFNAHSPTTIAPLLHEFNFVPTESNETTIEKPVAQKKSKKSLFSKKKPLVEDSSGTKSSVTTQSAICIEPEPADWLDDVLMTYDKEVNASKFNDFVNLVSDEGNMAGTSSYNAEDLAHQGTMAGRSIFLINDKATNTGDEFNISKGIQACKGTSNKKLYVFKERKSIYDIGIQTLPAYGEDFGTMKIYPSDEKIMYARERKVNESRPQKSKKVIGYIKKAKTLVRGILHKGRYCDSFTNTDFAEEEEEETEQIVIDDEESTDSMPQRDVRVKFSNFILECEPDGSRTQVSLPNKPATSTVVSRYKSTGAETTVLSIFSAVYNQKQALFSKKNNKATQNLFGFCKFGGGDGLDIFNLPTNLFTYPVITNKITMNPSKSSDFDPAPKKKRRRKLRRYRKPPRIKNPTGGKGTSSDEATKGKKKKHKKFRKKRKKTQIESKFSDLLENPDQEQLARELASLREREGQQSSAEIITQETNTTNDKEDTKEEFLVMVSTPSSTKTEEETPGEEVKQRPSGFKLLPKMFRRRKNKEKKGKLLKNSGHVVEMTPDDNTTKENEVQKKDDDKTEDSTEADKKQEDQMRKDKKKENKMKKNKMKKDKKKEDKMNRDQKKKDKKKEGKIRKDEKMPHVDKPDHVSKEVTPESPSDVHKLIITLMKKPENHFNLGDSTTTSSLHKLSSTQPSQENTTEVLEETSESNAGSKEALEKKGKKAPKKTWWNLWKKTIEITATKKSFEKESLEETTWLKIPIGGLELTGTETEEPDGKESEDIEDTEEGVTDERSKEEDEREESKEESEPDQPPAVLTPEPEDERVHTRYLIEPLHARSFPPMRGILPIVPELTAVDNRKIYNIHTFVGQTTTSNWPSNPFTRKNSFILVHEGGPSFESAQLSIDQRLIGSSSESSDDYLFRTEGDGETWSRMKKALLKSGIRQHISEDSNIKLYPTYEWRKFQTPSQLQLPAGVLSVEHSSETDSVGKFSFEEQIDEEEEPGSKSKFWMAPFDEEVEEFDEEGQPIHKEQLSYDKLMGERSPMSQLSEVRIDYHETGHLATFDLQNILDHLAEDHYDITNAPAVPPKEEEFIKQVEAASEFSILPKTEEQRVNPFESSLANVGKPIEEIDQDLDDYLKTIGFYQPKAIGVYQPEPKAYPLAQRHIATSDDRPQLTKPETSEAFIQPDFTIFLIEDHRKLKEGLGKIQDVDLAKSASVKVNTGQAQLFIKRSDPFAHMKNLRVTYLGNSFLVTIPEEMLSPTLEWCMTHKKVKEGVQALLNKNAIEVQGKLLANLAKGKKSVYSGADDEDTLYTLQALVALAKLNPRDAKKLSIFFAGICPNTKSDFMEVISRMKSEDAKSVFSAFGAMPHEDIRNTLVELFNIQDKHAQTAYLLKIAKEILKRDVACECKIPILIPLKKQKGVMAKVDNQSKNVGTDGAPMVKKKDAATDMKILKKEEVYPEPELIVKIERPDVRNRQPDVKSTEGKPVTRLERPDIRDRQPGVEKSTEFKPIAKIERPVVRNNQSPETSKEGGLISRVGWPDVKSCLFPGRRSTEDDPLPKPERSDVSTRQTAQRPTEDKSTMEMPVMRRRPTGYTSTEEDPWGQPTPCRPKEDPQYKREDAQDKREDPQYKREDPQDKREDSQYKREDPQNKNDDPQRDGSKARRVEWILKVLTPSEEGIARNQYTQSSVPPSPHHSRTPSRSSTPVTLDFKSGEVQTDETASWPTEAAIARVRNRLIPSFYKRDLSQGRKEKEFWSKIKEKRIPEKLGLIKKKDSCDKCCQIKETKPVDRNIYSLLGKRRSLRRKDRRKLAEDIAMGLSEDAENEPQQTSSTQSTQSTTWNALKQSKTTQYVHCISPYPINKGHSLYFIDNLGSSSPSSSVGNAEILTSSVTVTSETSYASLSDDLLNMIKKGNIMLDKEELAGVLSRKYRMPSPIREMSLFPTMAKVDGACSSKQPNKKGMQIKLHGDTFMSYPRGRSNSFAVSRSLLDDLLLETEEELGQNQKKVVEIPQAILTLVPLKTASKSHSAISDGSKVPISQSFLSSKSKSAVCIGVANERKSPFRNMFKAATDMLDRVNRFHQPMLDPLVKSNIFAKRKRISRTPSTESVDSKTSRSSRFSRLSHFSRTSWSSSTRTDLSTKTVESSEYSSGICENHCQTEGLCYCRVSRSRNKSKHSRPVETGGKSRRDFANHYQAEIKPYTCCAHSKKVTWHQTKEQPGKPLLICSNNELSSVTSIEKVKNQLYQGKRVPCPSRGSEYEEANSKLSVCRIKFRRKKKSKPSEGATPKDHHGFFSKFFSKRKKEDDHHDDPEPIAKPELHDEPEKLKICSSCRSKLKSNQGSSPTTSNDSILKMAKADIQQEKTLKQETTPKRKSWSILGRKKADPAKSQQPKARSLFMVRRHDRSRDEEPKPELAIVKDSMCRCPPHPNATEEQKQKRCFIKRIPSSIHRKAKRIEEAPKVDDPAKDNKTKHHFGDVFRHHPIEPCGCEPGHPEYPIVKKKSCCSKISCASPKTTPFTSEESTTSVKDCTPGCRGFLERVVPPTPKSSRCSLRKSAKSSKTSVKTADEASRKHSLNSILKKQHEKHDQKKKKKQAAPKKTSHHHLFKHHKKVELTPSEEMLPQPTKKKKMCSSCGKKKRDKASKNSSRDSLCTCELVRLEKRRQKKKKKCSSCGKPKKSGGFGSTDSVCMCDCDTPTRKKKTKKPKKQNKKKCSTCGKKKKHGKLSSKSSLCKCDFEVPNSGKQKGCSTCGKNKKSCASTSKESLCHCDSLPRKVKPPPAKAQPHKTSHQRSCSTCGKKKPTTPMESSTDFCKCGSQTSIRSSTSDHKRHISMRHTPRGARSRPSSGSELSGHGVEERLLCECTYSKFDVRRTEVPIVDIYSKREAPPSKEEVFQTLISMLMKRPRHKRYESTKRRKIKEYLSKVSSTELEDIVVEMVEQLPMEVRELIARMHKAQQSFLARRKGNIKYNASNSYFKKFNPTKTFNQPNRTRNPQSDTSPTSSMELPSSKYWKYDFYPNKDNYSIDIDKVEVFCKARSSNCMENASFTTNYGVSVSLGGDEAEEAMEIIKLLSKLSPRNLCQFFAKQYN